MSADSLEEKQKCLSKVNCTCQTFPEEFRLETFATFSLMFKCNYLVSNQKLKKLKKVSIALSNF
ncbi:CLUMA_CG015559, isoform A [Clunio marinus]|uniref:CLUMA_CG015559, isoform A n=1 Tax=Clunio marinus TaxID=568069 RepID=A0A1J1IP70_9DIPT|nr:CLUMA_CG015559, isoform A [Clunio marinus]